MTTRDLLSHDDDARIFTAIHRRSHDPENMVERNILPVK